ncbi:trypsin-like peptidase domain-containing protein [Streptomyces sp. NBC_00696]|uniref:trypsin-like peptidase domain-containing protein n=1 Tax=Streptomyces sp. NBC_00696 TaxID=2903672 RepID=UPI002E358428|nr:trypsin-like peptidase domain-containing protein [Streptomyces sp. NBC_00696]
MAGRGPRTGGARRTRESTRGDRSTRGVASAVGEVTGAVVGDGQAARSTPAADDATDAAPTTAVTDASLVRIRDLAGRPRGTGFVADHHGTVITSHEAVDGLPRLLLHAAGDRTCLVTADAVTPLPALDLALVRTEGLGVDPLPVTVRDRVETGTYVRVAAGCWREARVLAATSVTYTATDRFHLLDDALELAIGTAGRDALRLGGGAAGGPVLDAATGAVVGILGTALQSGQRDTGFAVPLRQLHSVEGVLGAAAESLDDLLARNAATVPAYGADLNLAGVLELTATSVGSDGPPGALAGFVGPASSVDPVERPALAGEFAAFLDSPAAVLGLVGPPGSGRTTELAALAARRNGGAEPAPTLWLRGADLRDDDTSVADAVRRAVDRAARIVAASVSLPGGSGELGDVAPERLARVARDAGRPLLLLLDGPEEMPPVLAHRLGEWTAGTGEWLRGTGARLVVGCRVEYWEGAGFSGELLYGGGGSGAPRAVLPACVQLGDLRPDEARRARDAYGIPEGVLTGADARHPLTLRLLSEVLAALPAAPDTQLDRDDVFSAYLDLMCLRIAVRLAAENGLRGTPVRRLAAKVSGQVHEAARRSLGPGQGELDRESFEAVFPWGPAPTRLGGGTGWASAVLTEGLLVPAGTGYRFAHEELADWIQGTHLDLDEALRALVHRPRTAGTGHPLPVPHHRIGPVVQALLLLARQHGAPELALKLEELTAALDADPDSWWAAHLLAEVLLRVPDATPYDTVLRLLADQLVARRRQRAAVPREFEPRFWAALHLPHSQRFELLRRLVLADGAPQDTPDAPRFLDTAAELLAADPAAVQPLLARWFDDERSLPATPEATVATAAQALLHTHRRRGLDELTEVLVGCAHGRADELLGVLAEEEPSAVCRAVDRWAHDERPARRVAAVAYGLRAAPHVRTEADRELLRYAAEFLLGRSADSTLHGGALALLVRDPLTRARHLPQALRHFASGDPQFPPSALAAALTTHPEPVLEAFRARLHGPDASEAVRTLADVATPSLVSRAAALVRETAVRWPETAAHLGLYVDRCLDHGPAARAILHPLVTGLLDGGPASVRTALAPVLAAPGAPASRPLRRELLEFLLTHEHDPAVLDALLHTAGRRDDDEIRDLVHRTGRLLVRTPAGATRFDRGLVDLGRHVPGFAALMARWLADTPEDWAAVVGPSTRRMIENLAGVGVSA